MKKIILVRTNSVSYLTRVVALLVLVGSLVTAWAACKQKCAGCTACTTAGALRSGTISKCDDRTYWNSSSFSDYCYDFVPVGENPGTGKRECTTTEQEYWGTVTAKSCRPVYSLCVCVTTDASQFASWYCTKATLSGDDCTSP